MILQDKVLNKSNCPSIIDIEELQQLTKEGDVKILLFDIETAPNLAWVWSRYEDGFINNLVADWYILSVSWKWLGEKKVHALGLPDFKGYKKYPENDRELVKKMHDLFSEADIIVAHNGQAFDVKKVNARFLVHGLNPPKPYKQIDTKLIAKKYFKFDSNKLDELARQLGVGRKMEHTGFKMWAECMRGEKNAWKLMLKYNKMDVLLLEAVYLKMRPWIQNFPITRPIEGECPNCGSVKRQKRGFRYTKMFEIQRLQCTHCGAWSDGQKEKLTV